MEADVGPVADDAPLGERALRIVADDQCRARLGEEAVDAVVEPRGMAKLESVAPVRQMLERRHEPRVVAGEVAW